MTAKATPGRTRAKVNQTTGGFRVSDALWAQMELVLPKRVNTPVWRRATPRAGSEVCGWHFLCVEDGLPVEGVGCDGHLFRLDSPCALPRMGGSRRVLEAVANRGLERFDELKGLDWEWLSMDGAMTKAPLGGGKTEPNPTDRAKKGVKRSLLTEAHGVPVGLVVAGANCPDMKLVQDTLDSIPVGRPEPTEEEPHDLCMDTGYDYAPVRHTLEQEGFTTHIRSRGEEVEAKKRKPGTKPRRWLSARIVG